MVVFSVLNMRSFPVELEVLAKRERISGLDFSPGFGGKRLVGKGWICLLRTPNRWRAQQL
jgi:hypothetical protein